MKSISKIISLLTVVCMAVSVFSVCASAEEVKKPVEVAGTIMGSNGSLDVNFTIPEGKANIQGIEFDVVLPTGFKLKSVVNKLNTTWSLNYGVPQDNTSATRVILYNNAAKTLEETAKKNAGGFYEILALNIDKGDGVSGSATFDATVTVKDITANKTSCGELLPYTCQFTTSDDHVHSFGNWIIDRQPDCVDEGAKHCECSVCHTKVYDVVPTSNAHAFGAYVITKKATCTDKGTKTRTCSLCKKVETYTIPALGHSTKTSTIAATYFAAGKKVTKCTVCGKITKTTSIAKKVLKKPTAKLTAAKKALKVKVNKVTGQTGFQIRYRLKGKSKWTTKTYTGKKTATKTIKLKAKKNYQVQVRAMVKSGSKKAYSAWSKTYAKKTK